MVVAGDRIIYVGDPDKAKSISRELGGDIIDLNKKITSFEYNHYKITNYEMESSALFGLSRMLGHEAVTICAIIANRINKTYSKDYHPVIKNLIQYTLDKLVD